MFDAFGNPLDETQNLVAAGSQWTAGGNSVAARRARVKLQRRDRYGRWAEMGGGISFWGRKSDGSVVRMIGRYIGPAERDGYMRVYVAKAGDGYKPGVYEVPGTVATAAKAIINLDDLQEAGIDFDVNGNRIGQVLDHDIESIATMFKGEANSLDKQLANDNPLTETEKAVQVKARLAEAPHISRNVVDENGNPIPQAEVPTPAKAQIPPTPKAEAPEAPKANALPKAYGPRDGAALRDLPEGAILDEMDRAQWYPNVEDFDGLNGEVARQYIKKDGKFYRRGARGEAVGQPIAPRQFRQLISSSRVVESPDSAESIARHAGDAPKARIGEPQAPEAPKAPNGPEALPEAKVVEKAEVPQAQAELPPNGPNGPNEPQGAVASQKFAKDIVVGDELIDTTALEQDPEKRHIAGKITAVTHDAVNGTATFTIDRPTGPVDITRRLTTPMGIDPQRSINGGNDLNPDGNAAHEEHQRLQGNAQQPPSNPPTTPPAPPAGGPSEPSDNGDLAYDELPLDVFPEIIAMDAPEGTIWQSPDGNFYNHAVVNNGDGTFSVVKDGNIELVRYNDKLTAQQHAIEIIANNILRNRPLDQVNPGQKPKSRKPEFAEPVVPGTDKKMSDWLKENLESRADDINPDLLTEDSPDPHTGAMRPGTKTMLKNLKQYREQLIVGMKEAALDNKRDEFMFKYAVAQRVTAVINAMYQNQVDGNPVDKGLDPNISVKNVDKKLGSFEIIASTIKTTVGTKGVGKGKSIITSFDAVTIGKDGKPYLYKWTAGNIEVFPIAADGTVSRSKAGYLSYVDGQNRDFGDDEGQQAGDKPLPGISGSIKIFPDWQAVGLASGFILLSRWAATRVGARYHHSSCLLPNGNFYSKTVSPDMRDNDRTQADKAIHQNNPNGTIFKIMKSLGWIDGTYKPLDPNNPGGSGGSGWLKRITINNSGGNGDNPSKLDTLTTRLARELKIVRRHYQQLPDAEKATFAAGVPEIFRDHITGEKENWDKWDIQYNLLSTVYADGMKKDQAIKMLDDIITGRQELQRLLPAGKWEDKLDMTKVRALRQAIEVADFVEADNNYRRPAEMSVNAIRVMKTPFAGYANFADWKVPQGVKQVENYLPFSPRRAGVDDPAGWTNNPIELATSYSSDELLASLREAIINGGGADAKLGFGPNKDQEGSVDTNAIFKALEEQGQDATMMLAKIYDEMLGDPANPNQSALKSARANTGNLDAIISRLRSEIGELDEPVPFDNIGGRFSPTAGVLHGDVVKRSEDNIGGDPALDLKPLSPDNEALVFRNGGRALSVESYTPAIPSRKWYTEGVTDNPKIIARNFSPEGLQNALSDAIRNSKSNVKLKFPNGEERSVPLEAIRDALQHQGIDVNKALRANEQLTSPPASPRNIKEQQDGPVNKKWIGFGVSEFNGERENGFQQVTRDDAGNVVGFSFGIVPGDSENPVANLVKIVVNPDGTHNVWVANRADGVTGDLSENRAPDGVYTSLRDAFYDVSKHLMAQANLERAPEFVRTNAGYEEPGANDPIVALHLLDEATPAVDVNGMNVAKPADVARRQVFGKRSNPRINNNAVQSSGLKVLDQNDGVDDGTVVEHFANIIKNEDGTTGTVTIYSVEATGNRFAVTNHYRPAFGGEPRTVRRVFATKEQAIAWGRSNAIWNERKNQVEGFEDFNHYRDLLKNIAAEAPSTPRITQDASHKVAHFELVGRGGQALEVVASIRKGGHPAWNRNGGPDNRFEAARVIVKSPGALTNEDPIITAKVVRVSSRRWEVQIENGQSENRIMGWSGGTYQFNTKTDAINFLNGNQSVKRSLGLGENDKLLPEAQIVDAAMQRREAQVAREEAARAERERLVRERQEAAERAAAAANTGDPNVAMVPGAMSNQQFQDFLATRAQLVDMTGARQVRGNLGGASGAWIWELPDGRKFKVKTEGSDKARMESFNHAIWRMQGVQATEALIAVDPRDPNKIILVDPFVDNEGKWTKVTKNENFNKPEYQQAIADLHEGRLIDVLMHQWDMNSGNAFITRDANGVLRVTRCDGGSGGVYHAIGIQRQANFDQNVVPFIKNGGRNAKGFGDFMSTGIVSGANEDGGLNRGLTKDALLGIARRTILPLTDDRINQLVDTIITNPQDRAEVKRALIRRRLEMLSYMGIDPNEAPPQGSSAAPLTRPLGVRLPNMADDGYEVVGSHPNGNTIIKLNTRVRPDGIHVPATEADWRNLSPEVKKKIQSGEFVPQNLPFMRRDVPREGVIDANGNVTQTVPEFIDANGVVRQSPYGMVSVMIRRRKADGSYEYLFVKPGSNDPTGKAIWGDKLGPLQVPRFAPGSQNDRSVQDIMREHLGVAVDPIQTHSFDLDIPGSPNKHRVVIADIGDQPLDVAAAERAGLIGDNYWKGVERLEQRPDRYWNQFDGQTQEVIGKVREIENRQPSSPTVEPPADNIPGDGGNGPSDPSVPGVGGAPSNGPTDPNGWGAPTQILSRTPDGNWKAMNVKRHANGTTQVDDTNGNVLGSVKPTYYGHFEATLLPNDIRGRDAGNGNAVRAIFASEQDAKDWLAHKIHDHNGAPAENRNSLSGQFLVGDAPAPLMMQSAGRLNPTTQDQRDFANRLIEQKVATPEERALYRAILSKDNLSVGEVGWVIGKLRGAEDRDSAEIADSLAAREVGAPEPIVNSSLDNVVPVGNTRAVRAGELVAGDRILGNVNAKVVFTAMGENDTMNVGVVGDDGKLRVYKVNRNSPIAIANEAPVAQSEAPVAPVHPAIVQRQAQARLTQDRIKAQYPNHRELPNGDLVVHQREVRQRDGQVFRYEAVVHKLKSDEFVSYVRRQRIDANGNPIGQSEAGYLTAPAHSPKVVLGRLRRQVVPVVNNQNPANGFNQIGDRRAEVVNPATGQLLPHQLVHNQDAQFIGDTGIEKTGNAVKDSLISYIHRLVARGTARPDIIAQVTGGNQNLFSRHQLDDIVERLEANRMFPGVNAIPYVSKDNATIVRVGDRVKHYDAFGQPILDANGNHREGTVVRRSPYTLNRKAQGDYEYSDQLHVQWDLDARPHQAAARRLEVISRADGTAPVPAVQAPRNGQPNGEPNIESLPQSPAIPLEPANAPQAPATNNDPLADAFTSAETFGQGEVDAINGRATLPFGMEVSMDGGNGGIRVHRQGDRDGLNTARILQVPNGYEVITAGDNGNGQVVSTIHGTKLEAVNAMLSRLNGGNGNQAPEAPEAPANPAPSANAVVNLPPNGRVDRPEDAQVVQSLADNEIPRNIYDVVRDDNGTRFVVRNGDNMGAEAFVTVVRSQNGWMATDPRPLEASERILYNGPDRRAAEMVAINRMTGADGGNNPVTPAEPADVTPTPQPGDSQMAIAYKNLGGKDIERRTNPADGSTDFYHDGNLVGRIVRLPDGRYQTQDQFSGDITNYDDQASAISDMEDSIANYALAGLLGNSEDGNDSGNGNGGTPPAPSTPPVAPANPANPASPAPVVIDGIQRDADGYEIGNTNDAINKQLGLAPGSTYQPPVRQFGGMWQSGHGWISENGIKRPATAEEARAFGFDDGFGDAPAPTPTPGRQPSVINPNNPPSPSGNGGNGGNPPATPNAPQAPKPAPEAKPAPQAKPRVNPVQPGDRRLEHKTRRNWNNDGKGPSHWDVIDNKTGRVIGFARTREEAEDMVAGRRDLVTGKLIDYTTPIAPNTRGPVKFPRPKGYKRTSVAKGTYIVEKENNPNAPVARVDLDEARGVNVGRIYANREDAMNQTNPIGEEFTHAGPIKIDGLANEALQKELDRLNPPAPEATPEANAPEVQPASTNHKRTDLGSDMFAVHDNDREYGIAEKGADGKWNIRVHENPRDAIANRNPIASGSYNTPEEAEAAIRKAIADKNAPADYANILQWQSGSDGKQYIGLDGVPGVDANNAPVYGVSPGPFGGWIVASWGSKADKDAGLPPVTTMNQPDEKSAKDMALDHMNQIAQLLAKPGAQPAAPAPAPTPTPTPPVAPAPRRRQQQWQGDETPPWLA
jgi:hypothetical protein